MTGPEPPGASTLQTLSLFSGIAGIEVGLAASGAAQPVAFCERWEPARSVLHAHFPGVPVDDDVTSLADLRGSNLVTGGFPCTNLPLPQIMQREELFHIRPSSGAGNDSGRRYDIETSHRVAEFKVALWRGADAMRTRTTFADLVALTLDESGRKAQLYVVGEEPDPDFPDSAGVMIMPR